MNKPFLKWAGNKYRLLPHLLPLIGDPKTFCEPFGGSLSVSLNVNAQSYRLNDVNQDLSTVYSTLLKSPESFKSSCKELFTDSNNYLDKFLELRDEFNSSANSEKRAKLFVYLNRHCFNGLTRYNKSGLFNVPFGKYKSPYFPEKELGAFYSHFSKKDLVLSTKGFESVELYSGLGKGDVVYFDPPYVPISNTANFTSYAPGSFPVSNHAKIVNIAKELSVIGVKSIISNSDCEFTRELYKDLRMFPVEVTRTVAAKGSSRGKASELIVVVDP